MSVTRTTSNVRIQAGAIPYRFTHRTMQVLIITSRRYPNRWLVPKGNIESGQTPVRCAAREAWEEAGVVGVVGDQTIGSYQYIKRGVRRRVQLYPLRVREQANYWPEVDERERLWVPIEDVSDYISSSELLRVMERMREALAPRIAAA